MLKRFKVSDNPTLNYDRNKEIWGKLTLESGEQVLMRPPQLSDATEITELLLGIVKEEESIPISESKITELAVRCMILKMQRTRNDVDLVVASPPDKKIIAFAEIEKIEFGARDTAKFGIAVEKAYRRKGIGRTLIKFLVERARCNEIRKIILLVPINNTGAIGFYKLSGFTEQNIDPDTLQELLPNPSTTLLMSRTIQSDIQKSNG